MATPHDVVDTASAVGAGLVAVAFAMSTLERWMVRRRPHELAWSVALAMFAIASAALAAGSGGGWYGPTFRVFYLFGAILNVPYLALGTVYLLAGRRIGNWCLAGVSLAAAFAAGVLVTSPFTHPLPVHQLARGSAVFGFGPQVLAGVGSGVGATVIVAGAFFSVLRYRRSRMSLANVLIAAGTLVTGASGLLNSVLDQMTGFAVTLAVGISVIFVGFLVASTVPQGRPSSATGGDGGRPTTREASLREATGSEQSRSQPITAGPI